MLRALFVVAMVALVGCSKTEPTGSGAPASSSAAKQLIFNTYLPPQDVVRQISVDDFAKRIEAESKGSLRVMIPDSSMAVATQQWTLVTDGVADIAMVPVYSQRAQLMLPSVADLPFNALSAEAASVALWNTQQKYFSAVNEFADVQLLSMHALPPFEYISNVEPVNVIGDFHGQKVWAAAGPPTEALKLVGAIPVFSQFSQLYEYAAKGNVDAFLIGPGTIKQAGIGDYVRYMTHIPGGMGTASFAIVMNKTTFGSLTEKQRAAILRAAEGLPQRTGRTLDERNRQALAQYELTINQADAALMTELEQRLGGFKAEWIKSAEQRGLTKAAEAFQYYHEQMTAVAGPSNR